MKYKIAILTSHLIQYQTPFFKKIAKNQEIDLMVYFYLNIGIGDDFFDPQFNKRIKWDIPLLEGYNYKFLGSRSFGIIKEIFNNSYDAIIVFGWSSFVSWLVFLTKPLHKTPIILRGESDLNKKIGFIKGFIKLIVLKILFKFTNAFLYSYSLNKEFYKFYGVPEKKLFFNPCAVDNERFIAASKELKSKNYELRKRLGIKKSDIVILFSGKLMERKRPMDLLKAFELLNSKFHILNSSLIFVGDGVLRQELENYTKENNLKDVHFVGFKNQTEIPEYYAMADIFVLPSEFDPSPKALNEAMNFGIPSIITTGVGTGKDLIMENEGGFSYGVGDIGKLAEYLKIFAENLKLRKKMGGNSLKTVGQWNFEKGVRGIIAALDYLKLK